MIYQIRLIKKIRIVKFGSRILKNPECQTQILKNPDCQLQVLKNSNMYWKFLIVKFRVSKIRIVKFGMWIIWRIKFGFQKVCIVKNQVRLCGPGVVEINKRGDHFIAYRKNLIRNHATFVSLHSISFLIIERFSKL